MPLFQLAVRYALPNVLAYILDKHMLPDGTDCAAMVEAKYSCMNDRINGGARPSPSDVLEVLKLLNDAVRTGHVYCGGGKKRPHDFLRVHLRHQNSTRPVKGFWITVDGDLKRQKEASRAFVKEAGLRVLTSSVWTGRLPFLCNGSQVSNGNVNPPLFPSRRQKAEVEGCPLWCTWSRT